MIIQQQRTIIHNRINLVHRAFESKQTEIKDTPPFGNRQLLFNTLNHDLNGYSDGVDERISLPHAEFITFMNEVQAACTDFEKEIEAV